MEANGSRSGRSIAALVVFLGMILVPAPASASGGGGCGQPVTDEAGTAVDIRDYCFAPTILRVAPGDEVTFANRDRAPHSVLGANGTWGSYELLKKGRDGVTLRFSESGVFPYVCTYHIGMVGVIVVGDGVGGAIGTTTADGPVTKVTASELDLENAPAVRVTTLADPESAAWPPIVVAAALGSMLVAGGAISVRRRRCRRRSMA